MNALTIARRDLGSYLHGYPAYVIMAALLLLHGVLFQAFALGADSARYSHEVLENFFYLDWGFAVATAVLLTMRSITDERATGTETLLTTSVLSDGDVILGKWLAAMGMVLIFTALTVYMPALIFVNGKVSVAHLGVGYLGVLLGGSVATAVGIFCSSLFRSQIPAGILSGVIVVYMSVVAWMVADILEPPFSGVAAYTALFNQHFVPFMEGRFSTGAAIYQVSLTALFLLLATQVLRARRWE